LGSDAYADPSVAERTLGDYLHPRRPGSVTILVNAVSREIGADAAPWSFYRLVTFVAGLERERRET